MSILNRFPSRVRIANPDGTPTLEFLRMLDLLVERAGNAFGDIGTDVFAAPEPTARDSTPHLVQQLPDGQAVAELVQQPPHYSPGTALDLVNYRFSLKDTEVAPGDYGDSTHAVQLSVDQQGRITAIAAVPIAGPTGANYSGSLTGKTVVISNGIITSVT